MRMDMAAEVVVGFEQRHIVLARQQHADAIPAIPDLIATMRVGSASPQSP